MTISQLRIAIVGNSPFKNLSQENCAHYLSNQSYSFPGLPKAARVGHLKAIMSMAFLQLCGATSDDNVYITLPLYHMSASLLGIGGCIQLGNA